MHTVASPLACIAVFQGAITKFNNIILTLTHYD